MQPADSQACPKRDTVLGVAKTEALKMLALKKQPDVWWEEPTIQSMATMQLTKLPPGSV